LAWLPPWKLPGDARYAMTAMPDGLYVLACTNDGWPLAMGRFAGGDWHVLSLPRWTDADGRVGSMIGLGGDLLWAGTAVQDGASRLWLRRFEARDESLSGPHWARIEDRPVEAPQFPQVAVCAYGGKLAMAWWKDGAWRVGLLDPNGEAHNVLPLTEQEQAWQPNRAWVQAVTLALTVALVLGLFVRQRQLAGRPFRLPEEVLPASWFKRIVAYMIDSVPFGLAATALRGISLEQLEQMWDQTMSGGRPDVAMVLGLMGVFLALFLPYCVLMERLLGATVGKMIFHMRVVGSDARAASWGAIILRNVSKPVELMQPMVLMFMIWPMVTRYRQRVGDMVADTAVVDAGTLVPSEGPDEGRPKDGER
jgi:uncharacterized RDD family membrane protein YckC